MLEYEYALNYVLWGRWDDLFTIMLRTKDNLLEKKIHQFLHAYYYPHHQQEMVETHNELLHYLEHAMSIHQVEI